MNKRRKKKAFKKRYGVNPPKGLDIKHAIAIYENKKAIMIAIERMKAAILKAWDQIKEPFRQLYEEIKKAVSEERENNCRVDIDGENNRVNIQSKEQERKAMKIEGNINVLNHERR